MLDINTQIKEFHGARADSIPDSVLTSTQPLVLRGLVSDWPMVTAANQSLSAATTYLQSFDSGKPLSAMTGSPEINGRIFYNSDLTGFNFEYQRMQLSEVLQSLHDYSALSSPPTLYVGSTNIDNWLPGFNVDNRLALDEQDPMVSIWICNQSRIAAHYDFPSNIACCVAGRRRFTLFPPDQLKNLYVGPIDQTPAGQPISLVDFTSPDYAQYPKFHEALQTAQVVELEPGDALLIPSMWWHHVESLDNINVLVNYWWRSTPYYLGGPLNVLQHGILGLRDLPAEQRQVWQQIFEHYVFNPQEEDMAHIPTHARGVLNSIDEHTAMQLRTLLADKLKQ